VRRIENRLRDAESRAPKPHEPLIWSRVIVAPNPEPGGPLIVLGTHSRTKTIPGGYLKEIWAEWQPEENLPDELLVSERYLHGRTESFDPPIPESQLPAIRRGGPSTPSDDVRDGVHARPDVRPRGAVPN
jgi:hypothetical protein